MKLLTALFLALQTATVVLAIPANDETQSRQVVAAAAAKSNLAGVRSGASGLQTNLNSNFNHVRTHFGFGLDRVMESAGMVYNRFAREI